MRIVVVIVSGLDCPSALGGSKGNSCFVWLANYTYPILDPGEYYIQPRRAHFGDMTCDCDTVMYR